jgi:hypothetical protein
MKNRRTNPPATADAIRDELVKACRYIAALEKSVSELASRLQEFDRRPDMDRRPWIERPEYNSDLELRTNVPPTMEGIMSLLRNSAKHIIALERDVAAMRGTLDQISND